MKVNLGMLKTLTRNAIGKVTGDGRPSWSLLTLHKAGSAYVAVMIRRIFVATGYESVDLSRDAFKRGVPEVVYVAAHRSEVKGSGRLFGPFRADTAGVVLLFAVVPPHP